MKEHEGGPLIWPNCACDSCVDKRKTLFKGVEANTYGDALPVTTRLLAEQVFFNPKAGPNDRRLAEKVLYPVVKPQRQKPKVSDFERERLKQAHIVERDCQECGKSIKVRMVDANRGWGKFCSLDCRAKHYADKTRKPDSEVRA